MIQNVIPRKKTALKAFASDNYAGVHPAIMDAIVASNVGQQISYGEDEYSEALAARVKDIFGENAQAYPVFNGTGANVVSLQAFLPRWGSVICANTAHINVDESNAPERIAGAKLLAVHTPDGKLTPELIRGAAIRIGDEHFAQPSMVSITQSTELGTVYTPAQLRAITDTAHELGLTVHMDGSRLSNAAAHLGVGFKELTSDVGVDILSFGGTKNGLLIGELVIDFTRNPNMRYLLKSNMQLGSKMRFLSAQFLALFENELWRTNAEHANRMTQRLLEGVRDLPGVTVTQPVEANAVFAILPEGVADTVREQFRFYDWDEARREVRWMCSFATEETDVNEFVAALRGAL